MHYADTNVRQDCGRRFQRNCCQSRFGVSSQQRFGYCGHVAADLTDVGIKQRPSYSSSSEPVKRYIPLQIHFATRTFFLSLCAIEWLFTSVSDAPELHKRSMTVVFLLSSSRMNGKRLSPTLRGQIMEASLWQSVRAVAARYGVSIATVSRLGRLSGSPTPDPPPRHPGGRPRVINNETRSKIKDALLENRWCSPSEVTRLLSSQGIAVSLSTVKRVMKAEGLRRYVARLKPHLTDKAKATRLAYALEHRNDGLDCWRRTICIDEAAIRMNITARRFVTRYQGEEMLEICLAPRLMSSRASIMIWAGIWHDGRSELVQFDVTGSTGKKGGVTAAIYRDQITVGQLRDLNRHLTTTWRGYGRPRVLEDNATVPSTPRLSIVQKGKG